jgi:imidazolonepropionase-like amidohydrolase
MKNIYTYITLSICALSVLAQTPKPAGLQTSPIAITNATIHVGNGEVINNGTVLLVAGKIQSVGSGNIELPEGTEIIVADGKHVYPGLIMPTTRLGLEEVGAVRATRDYQEVGSITPNVRSQIAFNTDSEILPTYRFNGILTAQVAPSGGFVTGTSSIMMLDGWNWEDATYVKDDAIHINWPSKTFGPRWWRGETARRDNDNYDDQVKMITDLFDDAKAYHSGAKEEINLKLEAVKGVLDGTQKVFVYADAASSIVAAVTTLNELGIDQIVIVGGEDTYYVRNLLAERDVPVILDNIHRRPARDDEPIDWPYRLPGLLQEAGVKVALRHSGMLARGRNLPFYAGTVAAYGVSEEEALAMVSSNTADILGVGDKLGTLEQGKDATLIISSGNILDMSTSIVEKAFIQGRDVEIEGKQQVLYERYMEKYSK